MAARVWTGVRVVLLAGLVLALGAPAAQALTAPGAVTFPARATGRRATVDPAGLSVGAALPGGSTVLAGGDRGVLLAKLRPDGAPDRTFGTAGFARIANDANAKTFVASADPDPVTLLRRPDGRFVFVGRRLDNGAMQSPATVLFGVTAAGRPDPAFNGGRPLTVARGSTDAAALAPDGSVIVGSDVYGAPPHPPQAGPVPFTGVIRRVTPAGALDPSFGTGGERGFDGEGISALAVGVDGAIFVATASSKGGAPLRRLSADGRVDSSFAAGEPNGFSAQAIVPTHGGVLLVGRVSALSKERVVRFADDGTPDAAFGTVDVDAGEFAQVVADPTGGVVLAGLEAFEPQPPAPTRVLTAHVAPDGTTRAATTVLPFGGGLGTFYAHIRLPQVGPLSQSGFRGVAPVARPDGSVLFSGAVAAIQYTGEGEGFSAQEAAVTVIAPDGTLDASFGAPTTRARVGGLRLYPQRARTVGDPKRRYIALRLSPSTAGLARLTVTDRGRTLARSNATLTGGGPHRVRAFLTADGRRILRHAGRTPIRITATFRNFVGAQATTRATGILR